MLKKNIVANIINKAWGFISVLAFTPLYLKLLGVEAYGLIGFYSTLLAMLAFADMGFTATLTREIAWFDKDEINEKIYILNLLRSYELFYMLISLLISISIWVLAPFIVDKWLNLSHEFNHQQALYAIRLMGIALALQLPSDLFFGGLMGLQHQAKANLIQISWSVFRAVGVVFAMKLISANILVFAFWQLISNLLYCIIIRACLWMSLNQAGYKASFNKLAFKNTWRYSVSMMFMAIIAICLTQSDKFVISKMLSLKEFSYYVLASSVAGIPLVMASPIANAVFPRFTSLIARRDVNGMRLLYLKVTKLVSILVITTGVILIFFSKEFIYAWTGSTSISIYSHKITMFLVIGQLIQSITVIPYYIALAHGNAKINLVVGLVSVILFLPTLYFMVNKFGALGGGITWMLVNLIVTPFYMFYIHKKFLNGLLYIWLIRSILVPCIIIITMISIFKLVTYQMSMDRIQIFSMMVAIWLIATSMSYFITNTMWWQEKCHI